MACVFEYLATVEEPCWGEELHYEDFAQEDLGVRTCEGHFMCSLYIGVSDEENKTRYAPKDK